MVNVDLHEQNIDPLATSRLAPAKKWGGSVARVVSGWSLRGAVQREGDAQPLVEKPVPAQAVVPSPAPPATQRKKSGKGFYEYPSQ